MQFKSLTWPRTLRARLLLLIVPLVGLSSISAGYFLIESGKRAIIAEKHHYLYGATHLLRDHLAQLGGYAALQRQAAAGESAVAALNRQLAGYTEEIAHAFPGIGVGYYHRQLDAILTYGPQAEYGATIGKPIGAAHRGRQVMASGESTIESGMQVRGNIMNAMMPIVEDGKVVGYVWANELIDDIDREIAAMRDTVLVIGTLTLLLSLLLTFWAVTRLTRDVSDIQRGLAAIENDLGQRIPPMNGETGEIVAAINKMAQSLFDSLQKERAQAAAALHQQRETLRTAIEAIDEAFVLYDPDDRLVYCNDKYKKMFPQAVDLLVPGNTFEYILRTCYARGILPAPDQDGEAWVTRYLTLHREGRANYEFRTGEGLWLQIVDRKAATGHIVGFRIDITRLKQATEAAEAANRKLAELATRDGLTGLFNRRHMDAQIDAAWADACARKTTFALLILDVDNFKKFNDRYGHQQGDDCLRLVATLIENQVGQANRPGDPVRGAFAARYGGEEFVVVLPGATREQYVKTANDIVAAIRRAASPHGDNADWGIVTASIGGAFVEPANGRLAALFHVADQRLFVAKKNGRNRVELDDGNTS